MRVAVIINEQHSMLQEQEEILNSQFESWELVKVPANGWSLEEIEEQFKLLSEGYHVVVFISPVPALLQKLALEAGYNLGVRPDVPSSILENVLVFHNDNRIKKELPNGRIIMTVAQTGWQLV